MKMSWLLVLAAPVMAADTVWWTGADGGALNDFANWGVTSEAEAPFDYATARDMGFKNMPSAEYTVTLTEDLVCNGAWAFPGNTPMKVNFDLGGKTLTFRQPYSSNLHDGVTNVLTHGTIAYKNASGTLLEMKPWSPRIGYNLNIGEGGRFEGNVHFADSGTKSLRIYDGGTMRGSIISHSENGEVLITGAGTEVDADAGTVFAGGQGSNGRMWILDGAVVTNVAKLAVGGDGRDRGEGDGAYLCISNAVFEMTETHNANQIGSRDLCCLTIGGSRSNGTAATHSNRVDVIGGAKVSFGPWRYMAVGDQWSHSNLLYIAGANTTFSNGTSLTQDRPFISGQYGMWNQIRVTDGAEAYFKSIAAGGQYAYYADKCVTSMWNRVTVDGGAKLRTEHITVSTRHGDCKNKPEYLKSLIASNVFEVLDGAVMTCNGSVTVGALRPSFGNAFVAKGEGTKVEISNGIKVGGMGSNDNLFEVTEGAELVLGGDINIGYGSDSEFSGANNVVRLDGCTVDVEKSINLGGPGRERNCLWIGDGSNVKYKRLVMRGVDSRVVVSNGTFEVSELQQYHGDSTEEDTRGGVFEFCGPNARFLYTGGSAAFKPFNRGFKFVFRVPDGGYAQAPFEVVDNIRKQHITIAEDTQFEFDMNEVQKSKRLPWTELMRDWEGIVMAEGALERIQAAASAARPGSQVALSADGKALMLRAPRLGFVIVVR